MKTSRALALLLALALLALVFLALPISTARADTPVIVRVKVDGATSGTCGDTWETACGLQYALTSTAALPGTELWVAAGTYTPTTGTDRTATFQLRDNIALYGGFAGGETLRSERSITANVTILSGNINWQSMSSDDSYHVVTGSGVTNTAILDGFTVTRGNATANNNTDPYSRGGGMYINGGSPTLSNVTFYHNWAGGFFSDGYGGGIYSYNGSPTLSNVTFISNSTSVHGYGGGMYSDYFSSPTLTNVTFSNNSNGGMMNSNGSSTLTNVMFSNNSEGGMSNSNSSATLTNVTFSGNSGGGMSNSNSSPTLTNVTFISNTWSGDGGGMFNGWSSHPTLTNVTFSGNSAKDGGGMYNYSLSNPTLIGVSFSGNWATNDGSGGSYDAGGGGMYNSNSSPTLSNVTFSGNSAINGGGILDSGEQSSPTLTDVTFISNTASTSGGGMYNYGARPTLVSVTFSGNHATDGGGIMDYSATSLTLTNVSLISNTASTSGGGMYNDSSYPTLTNVTFSANSATVTGGGISNTFGSHPTIRNAILWGNTAPTGSQIDNSYTMVTIEDSVVHGGYPGTHIISADPRLGPLGNYGGSTQTIPLLPGSSAIDEGNGSTCAPTDQRGKARVGTCDIGAFEAQGFTLTKTSGDNQGTFRNTAFANPLRVTVSSASGEPVNGGVVTFTAPSSGASATPITSTVTIASGAVSLSLTANGTAGSYAVTADTFGAVAPVSFALTNLFDNLYLPLLKR